MTVDITAHLDAWSQGDPLALEAAMPGLYEALRGMARQRMSNERGQQTLDPTDLVHEAMARLLGSGKAFQNRQHFLAVAALYMRSILTDRARAIQAGRRPVGAMVVTMGQADNVGSQGDLDLATLDHALTQLEELDPRAARAFAFAGFSGMTREEIADVLSVSVSSVDRDLRFARAWLNDALS
ncbi:MAG: ECF-type sigma factor [Rhodanobacter sp.]